MWGMHPVAMGAQRRKTSIQLQGKASSRHDNLAGETSCVTHIQKQTKGNIFSVAPEVQASALGSGRRRHFFLLGHAGGTETSWIEEFDPRLGRTEAKMR